MCFFKKKQSPLELKTRRCLKELTARTDFATIKYTVNKIVKPLEKKKWYHLGQRKVLYTCKAYIKAGINLDRFSFKDVEINESHREISIRLPKAVIISYDMPSDDRKKVYEKVSGVRKPFDSGEMHQCFMLSEKAILEDIEKMGITEEAQQNASSIFKAALYQLGYETVNISFNSAK